MKRMFLDLIKYGPILLFIVFGSKVFASHKPIVCHTHRGAKIFQIVGNQVSVDIKSDWDAPRRPASIFQNARNKLNAKGLTKIVFFEGHKHTLHIENVDKLNEVDDYVTISSKKGHEITYPLNCKNK